MYFLIDVFDSGSDLIEEGVPITRGYSTVIGST